MSEMTSTTSSRTFTGSRGRRLRPQPGRRLRAAYQHEAAPMTHRINTANPSAIDVAARELTAERLKTLREVGLVLYHEANGKLWFMCRSYYEELTAAGQLTEGVSGTVPA